MSSSCFRTRGGPEYQKIKVEAERKKGKKAKGEECGSHVLCVDVRPEAGPGGCRKGRSRAGTGNWLRETDNVGLE